MSDSNICEQCGGSKTIWFKVEAITKADLEKRIELAENKSTTPFKICHGHPEPTIKHDGNLGDGARVCQDNDFRGPIVVIRGKYNNDIGPEDAVSLPYKQFLSLLAWGEQNRATMEQLAKEQEE